MKVKGKEVSDEFVQDIIDALIEEDSKSKCSCGHCDDCDKDDMDNEVSMEINNEIVQNIVAASDFLDPDAFENGVKSVSELCGKVAALSAVGIDPVQALNYFGSMMENEYALKNNKLVTETNGATQVKCAELGAVANMS